MRRIRQQAQFTRDLRRQRRRGKDLEELIAAVETLAETGALPDGYRPHLLSGEWKGVWECHIEPDWLLIYEVTDDEVLLVRTGTHSDLFRQPGTRSQSEYRIVSLLVDAADEVTLADVGAGTRPSRAGSVRCRMG